jgi:lysylphosphatidylglycerol synthetase-like protein (DUF2156 family)
MANRQITADTPDPLVLDMYKHLAEQSQHFNGIESTYRTLASTWLLASFGGMGFILKDLDQYKGQQALFIAAVAVAAAVGIVLLWLMDLMVYHRLLAAAFAEQLQMETRHAWLPQVARGMMAAHGGKGVTPKVVWFYLLTFLVLVGIAVAALAHHALSPTPSASWASMGSLGVLVTGLAVALRMYQSAHAKNNEQGAYANSASEKPD